MGDLGENGLSVNRPGEDPENLQSPVLPQNSEAYKNVVLGFPPARKSIEHAGAGQSIVEVNKKTTFIKN